MSRGKLGQLIRTAKWLIQLACHAHPSHLARHAKSMLRASATQGTPQLSHIQQQAPIGHSSIQSVRETIKVCKCLDVRLVFLLLHNYNSLGQWRIVDWHQISLRSNKLRTSNIHVPHWNYRLFLEPNTRPLKSSTDANTTRPTILLPNAIRSSWIMNT
jgi:hypothetical protein